MSLSLKLSARILALVFAFQLVHAAADYDHSATVGPANGWLIVHGGGTVTPAIAAQFVEHAGGVNANFVVIPTAGGDSGLDLQKVHDNFCKRYGVTHVTVLHTRDRERANSPEFVEALKQASGVWILGGRQWRLADAYGGTAVEREIKALLNRGGIVGGSSAGATIQGSFLVRGAPGDEKNPDGDNRVMMVAGHEVGFALLKNSAIDQHVIVRHRESDLDSVIAAHPKLLGIGIDETGAILVHGDSFEVIGDRQVLIHDGKDHNGKKYYVLSPGQHFDLKTRATM